MADTKISALPAVTVPLVTDEYAVNQGGASKKITLAQLAAAIPGSGYDPGTTTLPTESFDLQYEHLKLSGTNRLTMEGTSEMFLSDFGQNAVLTMGQPKTPTRSWVLPTDWEYTVFFRLGLAGTIRGTLVGTSDLIVSDDFGTRSRITLAGRGF